MQRFCGRVIDPALAGIEPRWAKVDLTLEEGVKRK